MNKENLLLQEVFRKVFENPELNIQRENTAADIQMWDSLTHLELMDGIEKTFHIQFSLNEVMNFNCIGDILDAIALKLQNEKPL